MAECPRIIPSFFCIADLKDNFHAVRIAHSPLNAPPPCLTSAAECRHNLLASRLLP
jgi:hypothetical protein